MFLSVGGSSAFFKNLTVGSKGCVLKPGNLVKLRISAAGKGGGTKSPITYGCITGFEIPDGVEAEEVIYSRECNHCTFNIL